MVGLIKYISRPTYIIEITTRLEGESYSASFHSSSIPTTETYVDLKMVTYVEGKSSHQQQSHSNSWEKLVLQIKQNPCLQRMLEFWINQAYTIFE